MDNIIYFLGQFFGIVAVLVGFVCFQMKSQKGILSLQIATASLFALHYLFIGAMIGTTLNIVAAVMCVAYYIRDKRGSNGKALPVFFTILVLVMSILTWDRWYCIFIAIGLVLNAICLAFSNPQRVRMWMLIKTPMCFIYNAFTFSLGGMAYELAAFISSVIGIIRERKNIGGDVK